MSGGWNTEIMSVKNSIIPVRVEPNSASKLTTF